MADNSNQMMEELAAIKRLLVFALLQQPGVTQAQVAAALGVAQSQISKRVTIDDILSFAKVRKVEFSDSAMPENASEKQFKNGVTAVLREGATFKDWGGEYADLYTTRLVYKRRRLAAAFAFKGPGEKRKLVPGRMGVNGDQIQRMFHLDAEIFFCSALARD